MAEQRAHGQREIRTCSQFEARQNADGSWKVGGYASTFNDPYEVHDRFGTFTENILTGTWDRSLSERGHKIHILESHSGVPLGSTKAENLRLATDTHGLEWDWSPNPRRMRSVDIAEGIADGSIDEMSVGMRVPTSGDNWSEDMTERQISEASLLEISVVARGANPNTEATSREAELIAEIRELRTLIASQDVEPETVTLDTNLDGLRALLNQREARLPISNELAQLLQRRK